MQTEQRAPALALEGTASEKKLANRLFHVFLTRGRFFSTQAPIRLTLEQLTGFMEQQESGSGWAKKVESALAANPAVFARVVEDGQVVFATTRAGTAPVDRAAGDAAHTLQNRFAKPEPKRDIVRRKAPLARQSQVFAEYPQTPPSMFRSQEHLDDVPRDFEVVEPTLAKVQEARERARAAEAEADVEREAIDEIDTVVAEQPVVDLGAVDVASAETGQLQEAVRESLGRDLSVARWGDLWMAEDRVQRFSRGDLRRIEDFLRDQGGVGTDEDIVQDILGVRSTADEYPGVRFALNYRLSREPREFEYIGTDTLGVWALANQPAIGTTRRKPSEIGQDYRFLLDYRTPDEGLEEGIVEHVLSFYEYTYGVLPLDANLATLLPRAGFADQRAARVTFESPQTGETIVTELRFPTGNRGGFIAGLEQFFADNLVPGAVVTIERTDRSNHFLLEYFQVSGEDRKLLHLDERKGKYAFRSTTFYCATQTDFVLTEGRFPKFADAKPLDERARRKPEVVVQATFERVGEQVGDTETPRFWASFSDLMAAANVERPISAEYLRDILMSGTYPEFSADESTEDAYFYQPAVS